MPSHFSRDSSKNQAQNFKIKEVPHLSSPLSISQLNYSHNDIRIISSHIATATNLQILDLSHNKIRKIEYIYLISSLKFVNLSFNLISEIPNEILSMAQLQNLDVSYNKISILSNIRILKSLVQIRVFQKKGSIEINLEGNEVMNKKSCRDAYQKWMRPYLEECQPIQKSLQYENIISMTNKRNSKSLQLKHTDISGLQTKRIIDYFHQKEQMKMVQLNKEEKYVQEDYAKGNNQNSCLSPNFANANLIKSDQFTDSIENNIISVKSQMINCSQNSRELPKVQLSRQMGENSQLGEWFSLCLGNLKELNNNFSLIITNQDIKNLDPLLKQKIIQESLYARELIAISQETINLSRDHSLSKDMQNDYLIKMEIINVKIKNHHHEILKLFSQKQNLPIKLYKPWVSQFRRLKQIVNQIPQKVVNQQLNFVREQQINQLINISPDKIIKLTPPIQQLQSQQKSNNQEVHNTDDKNKLSDLLFSKSKDDFLLLSGTRSLSTSEKKKQQQTKKLREGEECEQCLLSRWQHSKTKKEMKELTQKIEQLLKQRNEHLSQIEDLLKFKQKYLGIECKQELIIEELDNLTPSTYQNILLEQAKAIQFMINSEYRGQFHQLGLENACISQTNDKIVSTDKMTVKQSSVGKDGINTRLSSNKNTKTGSIQANIISEFTINDGKQVPVKENSNNTRGSSYFKNKNIITTVNKTDDPLTYTNQEDLITEGDFIHNQANSNESNEIIVSQFNSQSNNISNEKNAIGKSQNKKANLQSKNGSKSKEKSKLLKMGNERTEKSSEGDVILLSQGSDLKNMNNSKSQALKYSSLGENKATMLSYIESQQFNKILSDKLTIQKQYLQKENKQKWPNSVAAKQMLKKKSTSPSQMKNSLMQITPNDSLKQNKNDMNKKKKQSLKRAKTTDKLLKQFVNDYKEHHYVPMQSQEGQRYKKYLQYHLRNNIIEILSKKTANIQNDNTFSKKWNYLTSSHKLIHKKIQNSQQQDGQTDGRNSQINKTFR